MERIKKLIPYNYNEGNSPAYIVVHDTGNPSKGADAMAHYHWLSGGNRGVSSHYFVDDHRCVQVVEESNAAWHCGDGKGRYGVTNRNSISVELCVNMDGDYEKAFANTVAVVREIMQRRGIDADHVVRHYDASRKQCPASMSANSWARWKQFKTALTQGNADQPTPTQPTKPATTSRPTVKSGSTGDAVKTLQKRLTILGYPCGAADGIFGVKTKYAVQDFQRKQGIAVDGIVGTTTWARLDAAKPVTNPHKEPTGTIRKGATGEGVKWVQEALRNRGYYVGASRTDGIFGSGTDNAVRCFQREHGLSVDGIVGPATRAALRAV